MTSLRPYDDRYRKAAQMYVWILVDLHRYSKDLTYLMTYHFGACIVHLQDKAACFILILEWIGLFWIHDVGTCFKLILGLYDFIPVHV